MAFQQEEIDYQVPSEGAKKPVLYSGKGGVHIVVNSLGALELVLECFKSTGLEVPVNAVNFGFAVTKDDVLYASLNTKKEYAAIFALRAKVAPEVLDYAKQLGVQIDAGYENDYFPRAKAFLHNVASRSYL